jgi:hypothetical protein
MCLALAIVSLRGRETLERMRRPPTDLVHQMGAPKPQPTTDVVSAPYTLPPITDNALLWKELYVGGPIHLPALALLVLALPFVLLGIVIILAWVVAHLNPGRDPADFRRHFGEFSSVVRFFYYVFLATCVLEVGYRAAVTVASERQNQTLVPLLLLPIERGDILVAKLVGVLLHGWPWLALIGADVVLGVMIGAYHPFSAILLCLTPWPVIVFVATLGLLLSVAMRTVLRAALTTLLLQLAIFVFTCVLPLLWGSRPFIDRFAFSFRDGEPENFESIALPLVQLLPFAVAAFVCWKLAVRTFENRSGTD